MARTSHTGYMRQYGGTKSATPATFLAVIQFDLDPTVASFNTGFILPKGSVPMFVQNMNGGATGGASPTIDVGTQADNDGLTDELAAEVRSGLVRSGDLIGTELTVDTPIFAGVGASAATGGSVRVGVYYIMADDGKA